MIKMINVNSPTFNKQLRKEKTPDGKYNYIFSDSDVMEIYNGAIHDMSYEQLKLFKKNYMSKKMPTFENNFKQANYSNMLKITLKESEFRTLIEKTVRKALKENINEGEAWASDGGYYNKPEYSNTISTNDANIINDTIDQFKRDITNPETPILVDNTEKGKINMEIINDLTQNWNVNFENDIENGVNYFWLASDQDLQNAIFGLENAWQIFYDKVQESKSPKMMNETTSDYATDEDPVDDNVLPSGLQDWLDENYPQEMREGMRGYERIINDLGEKNQLTLEIIDFFVKNIDNYAESWIHNLKMFKERCERYKQYYNITE